MTSNEVVIFDNCILGVVLYPYSFCMQVFDFFGLIHPWPPPVCKAMRKRDFFTIVLKIFEFLHVKNWFYSEYVHHLHKF